MNKINKTENAIFPLYFEAKFDNFCGWVFKCDRDIILFLVLLDVSVKLIHTAPVDFLTLVKKCPALLLSLPPVFAPNAARSYFCYPCSISFTLLESKRIFIIILLPGPYIECTQITHKEYQKLFLKK